MKNILRCVLFCAASFTLALLFSDRYVAAQAADISLPIDTTTLKITVEQNGIYEIDYDMLLAAGIDPAQFDPTTIEMMNQGQTVAYQWNGDMDNTFEAGESATFYGWAFDGTLAEQRYVGEKNVFWMWSDGSSTPIEHVANETGLTPRSTFPETLTFEENHHFTQTSLTEWGASEPDEWYWDQYGYYFHDQVVEFDTDGDGTVDKTQSFEAKRYYLDVPHPAAESDVQFSAEFLTSRRNMQFDVTVSLGDGSTQKQWTADPAYVVFTGTTTSNWLIEGWNFLTVNGQVSHEDGSPIFYRPLEQYPSNLIYFNQATITYTRQTVATEDELLIKVDEAGEHQFEVSGLTQSSAALYQAWDVSDHHRPTQITLTDADLDNGILSVGRKHNDNARLFITADWHKTPSSVERYTPSDLMPTQGAEWVAITHNNLLEPIEALAAYRQSADNLTTHVVDVQDVINQYGYGFATPANIQKWLRHAYATWEIKPQYLVLGGDGSWNPLGRDCLSCNTVTSDIDNFVPTDLLFIDPFMGMMTTDYHYSLLDNDGTPDVQVGRLPATTQIEMQNIVDKIIRYEANIAAQEGINKIVWVSDNESLAGSFCLGSQQLQDTVAATHTNIDLCLDTFNESYTNPNEAKASLQDTLFNTVNTQAIDILNYHGHGSIRNWANNLVAVDDGEKWQNTEHPVVILSGTALDTDFARDGQPSLGETFISLDDAGSAAHIGNVGIWAFDSVNTTLQRGFYEGLATDDLVRIGGAFGSSQQTLFDQQSNLESVSDVPFALLQWTLLGDPAMVMSVSAEPNNILFLPTLIR